MPPPLPPGLRAQRSTVTPLRPFATEGYLRLQSKPTQRQPPAERLLRSCLTPRQTAPACNATRRRLRCVRPSLRRATGSTLFQSTPAATLTNSPTLRSRRRQFPQSRSVPLPLRSTLRHCRRPIPKQRIIPTASMLHRNPIMTSRLEKPKLSPTSQSCSKIPISPPTNSSGRLATARCAIHSTKPPTAPAGQLRRRCIITATVGSVCVRNRVKVWHGANGVDLQGLIPSRYCLGYHSLMNFPLSWRYCVSHSDHPTSFSYSSLRKG